jgi:exosortase A
MHSEPQIELTIARTTARREWRAFGLVLVVLAAVLAVFWQTLAAMAEIWNRSETFTHGWLVIPAFVWFAWERRKRLAAIELRPFWPGLALIVLGGVAWLAAYAAGVGVVQQLAMVGLVAAGIATVLGWRFARELAFPLAFLVFAVPMGEALVPTLMSFTADFTVAALRLSGVPVYREGLYFVIPSGQWGVVEACSGLRYLIASVTVGCVFAYLTYRSTWRRLAFIGLAIAVPIVANWVRAYLIVMLGHLSGNRLAVGADHLIYGWVFFGLVMLLLFWIGSRWREDGAPLPAIRSPSSPGIAPGRDRLRPVGAAAAAALLVTAAWPVWAAVLDHRAAADTRVIALAAPAGAGGWQRLDEPLTDWRPRYVGANASVFEIYARDGTQVALYVTVYRNQKPGKQLISTGNVMVDQRNPRWSNVSEARRSESVGGSELPLRQTRLRSDTQRLLVWDWFVVAGQDVASPYRAKLLQARERLMGRGDDGVAIVVAVPYHDSPAAAEQALREFLATMRPSIDAAIAAALGDRG